MAKIKTVYVCGNCGSIFPKWMGKCSECGTWNSIEEEIKGATSPGVAPVTFAKSVRLDEIKDVDVSRFLSGINEFDTVLGGGIVQGSVILIGGEPGIGKSTIMLQIAGLLDTAGKKVLYVSGEESAIQIRMRADRLGVNSGNLELLPTNSLENILSVCDGIDTEFLIVDSIQTVTTSTMASAGGTVSQVKYITYKLVERAKSQNITVLIVGQITKDGSIAGPKVLEHLVDTVLYFEGDYNRGVRILRSVKNRFGSTNEVGIFEMSSKGLLETDFNKFIDRGSSVPVPGKCICSVMEGSRPLLVELQSLVSTSFFQFPKRNSMGFDLNRLVMLIAILEKKGGVNLSVADVYLNVAGGMKVNEPGADLAICAALISGYRESGIGFDKMFIGEVGLTGEVRTVPNMEGRINEAYKFGVRKFYVPSMVAVPAKSEVVLIDSVMKLIDYF